MVSTGSDFMGRAEELALLRQSLRLVAGGSGRVDLIGGEPGIGKTRLAEELTEYARAAGFVTLWGRAHEEGGAPPFWPWAQALEPWLRERDPGDLRDQLGGSGALVAVVLPQVRALLPGVQSPVQEPDASPDSFAVFHAVNDFLESASRRQPMLVVLDDLHWADQGTLRLLGFVARESGNSRLHVVGTYRESDLDRAPFLAEALAETARERRCTRHHLEGWSRAEVEQYLAAAGDSPGGDVAARLRDLTQGNPLFVREMARQLLVQSKALGHTQLPVGLPTMVQDVILARLRRLSPSCRTVMETAAIIGQDFTLKKLLRVMPEWSEQPVEDAVDEALRGDVVQEAPTASHAYRFVHELVRQAILGALPLARKVALYGIAARAMESLYGDDREAHAAELAMYFGHAVGPEAEEKTARYALRAGEQAFDVCSYAQALGHFQQGLDALKPAPIDELRARLHTAMGKALGDLGKQEEAFSHFSRSLDLWERTRDADQASALVQWEIGSRLKADDALRLCDRVLRIAEPGSRHEASALLRRGFVRAISGHETSWRDDLARALHIAQRRDDLELQADAHGVWMVNTHFHALPGEAREHAPLFNGLVSRISYGPQPFREIFQFYADLYGSDPGDTSRLRRGIEAALQGAKGRNNRDRVRLWTSQLVYFAYCDGDWAAARSLCDILLKDAKSDDPGYLWIQVLIERLTGNDAAFQDYRGRWKAWLHGAGFPPEDAARNLDNASLIAVIAAINGDQEGLAEAVSLATAYLDYQGSIPIERVVAHCVLALAACLRNDDVVAERLYRDTAWFVPGVPCNTPWSIIECPLFNATLGRLAVVLGRADEAIAHYRESCVRTRRVLPDYAWTRYELSTALLERALPDDVTEARSLLEDTRDLAARLGMPPLARRVATLLAGMSRRRDAAYPDGLTAREVEVLGKLSAGRIDKEIAAELFISIRTVSNHVASILKKTRTANRTEATRYAIRHGLAGE